MGEWVVGQWSLASGPNLEGPLWTSRRLCETTRVRLPRTTSSAGEARRKATAGFLLFSLTHTKSFVHGIFFFFFTSAARPWRPGSFLSQRHKGSSYRTHLASICERRRRHLRRMEQVVRITWSFPGWGKHGNGGLRGWLTICSAWSIRAAKLEARSVRVENGR